jgi:predicted MPP superfamily phosphohydrolase
VLWIILLCIIIAILIVLLIFYAFVYEVTNFTLSEANIYITDSSDNSKGEDDGHGGNVKCQHGRSRKDNVECADDGAGKPLLTILHLSDFHLRKNFKGRKLSEFVKSLSRLKPDFIFITGDLLGGGRDGSINNLIDMLSHLKAKQAKYAVLGVHDHYDKAFVEFVKNMFKRKRAYRKENDISYLAKRLKETGIEILINEKRLFELDDNKSSIRGINSIEIIGLDDPVINKMDIGRAFSTRDDSASTSGNNNNDNNFIDPHLQDKEAYKRAYREVFKLNEKKIHTLNEKGKLRIALIHTPDNDSIISLAKRNTDIIFCGHTHGGQVRLPFIGAVISGCKLKTKFASGLFYFTNTVLYVTRGLGEGKYSPFRFYCQPEVSLVNIYKK